MRLGIENPGPAQDQQEPMVIDDPEDGDLDQSSVRGRIIDDNAAIKFAKNMLTYLGLGIDNKTEM